MLPTTPNPTCTPHQSPNPSHPTTPIQVFHTAVVTQLTNQLKRYHIPLSLPSLSPPPSQSSPLSLSPQPLSPTLFPKDSIAQFMYDILQLQNSSIDFIMREIFQSHKRTSWHIEEILKIVLDVQFVITVNNFIVSKHENLHKSKIKETEISFLRIEPMELVEIIFENCFFLANSPGSNASSIVTKQLIQQIVAQINEENGNKGYILLVEYKTFMFHNMIEKHSVSGRKFLLTPNKKVGANGASGTGANGTSNNYNNNHVSGSSKEKFSNSSSIKEVDEESEAMGRSNRNFEESQLRDFSRNINTSDINDINDINDNNNDNNPDTNQHPQSEFKLDEFSKIKLENNDKQQCMKGQGGEEQKPNNLKTTNDTEDRENNSNVKPQEDYRDEIIENNETSGWQEKGDRGQQVKRQQQQEQQQRHLPQDTITEAYYQPPQQQPLLSNLPQFKQTLHQSLSSLLSLPSTHLPTLPTIISTQIINHWPSTSINRMCQKLDTIITQQQPNTDNSNHLIGACIRLLGQQGFKIFHDQMVKMNNPQKRATFHLTQKQLVGLLEGAYGGLMELQEEQQRKKVLENVVRCVVGKAEGISFKDYLLLVGRLGTVNQECDSCCID